MQALVSLSLSHLLSKFENSLDPEVVQVVPSQHSTFLISDVLPNQIRGKNLGPNKHTGSEQELMSDFASDASKEYN